MYSTDLNLFYVWNGSQTINVYDTEMNEVKAHSVRFDVGEHMDEYEGGEEPPRKIQDLGVGKARKIVFETMEELENEEKRELNYPLDQY